MSFVLSNGRFTGFKSNLKLEGSHVLLSPSNPAWLRWTKEQLLERLTSINAAALGTELHQTAALNIKHKLRMDLEGDRPILAAYVNDAIDLGLSPERLLFFSMNCYGTADAIGFNEDEMFLRVHDLKTGVSKVSADQLYIYAALFCLVYGFMPFEIRGELRIYQGEVFCYEIDRNKLAQAYDTICSWEDTIEEERQARLGNLA